MRVTARKTLKNSKIKGDFQKRRQKNRGSHR